MEDAGKWGAVLGTKVLCFSASTDDIYSPRVWCPEQQAWERKLAVIR